MRIYAAIQQYKIDHKKSCFGSKGGLTEEQFAKNCERAEKMFNKSRW
jgi:hypothetical protein